MFFGRVIRDLKKMKESALGYLERETARQRDQNEQNPRGGTMAGMSDARSKGADSGGEPGWLPLPGL